jgi:hypothetical protein
MTVRSVGLLAIAIERVVVVMYADAQMKLGAVKVVIGLIMIFAPFATISIGYFIKSDFY